MTPADQAVLQTVVDWLQAGRGVHLVMVLRTWGSSPRPAGALWALAEDGASIGSVSGGCLEEELARDRAIVAAPNLGVRRHRR
jgi:xanthine dehydrogenase accessory factor